MSLTLHVDGPRWRAHLESVAAAHPGLVPVAKGNGYGLTVGRLARRAQWLRDRGHDVPAVAVGTYDEIAQVAPRWDGDIVVLTPWRPWIEPLEPRLADRVVHTVSRAEDVGALLAVDPRARLVLEQVTSMQRHGMRADDLWQAASLLRRHPGARFEGFAIHLPLGHGAHVAEVGRLLTDAVGAGLGPVTAWVSHLSEAELDRVRSAHPGVTLRPRIGTALWLGDRGAFSVRARVLDVHAVARGEEFGYRGRSIPRDGHLLVVSGGTAHGIGLEAPAGDQGLRSRVATVARGGLDAAGWVKSPFTVAGKARLFAEPPHMQASMLYLPAGAEVPEVGDEVDVRVRYTATDVDRVVISD
ncbi:alanine racemase [Nocardioides panacisoli]|uniref:alanine racemase n=1 Tax=Nocardioides panacisoli TaxID=627624 RepID=UPI001C635EC1|nr:alanine racemase [Nocardioides panacisoli]QYJ03312.1 alanine racemase [Nocardioides panacisoli]